MAKPIENKIEKGKLVLRVVLNKIVPNNANTKPSIIILFILLFPSLL